MGLCTQALLAWEAKKASLGKLFPISKFNYIICELDHNKLFLKKFKTKLKL